MAIIIGGAFVFALGGVELLFNVFGSSDYSMPMAKIAAGLIILALGYIQLELELLRMQACDHHHK